MADALIADFTKRFSGGAVIRGELNRPARGHSVTVLLVRRVAARPRCSAASPDWNDRSKVRFSSARKLGLTPSKDLSPTATARDWVPVSGLRAVSTSDGRGNIGHGLQSLSASSANNESAKCWTAFLSRCG